MADQMIRVRDLYEGAYLLCRGLKMKDLTVTGTNGKKIATFTFQGQEAIELAEEYRSGQATVNVALLKFTLNNLKDRMFARIREREACLPKLQRRQDQREEIPPCSDSAKRSAPSAITPSTKS